MQDKLTSTVDSVDNSKQRELPTLPTVRRRTLVVQMR
ncbi:MAG: hypothetical protein MAG451_02769 [Anaerolineales bacterium]|nr:hypothetical protein [Anaerolineales bacterium]